MLESVSWICCQIGAREHYAIPRVLHLQKGLHILMTDAWVPPDSWLKPILRGPLSPLIERFHTDLQDAPLRAFTPSLLRFETRHRLAGQSGWVLTIARNQWFQQRTLEVLRTAARQLPSKTILFAYSYAAHDILQFAREQGWFTVLGQIDPGPVEEAIVTQEHSRYPTMAKAWAPAPEPYWKSWFRECERADLILVNSTWSQQALVKAGVSPQKLKVVPLAYTSPTAAEGFHRQYPIVFSVSRPMRVLFLGQIILRKGVAHILEAAKQLQHEPIEWWFVGHCGINPDLLQQPNIKWMGAVNRSTVYQYYRDADVFLFPTLSDGFGLTQLEAQAWKLPAIVSINCAEVVRPGINGLVLQEVSGQSIAQAVLSLFHNPEQLIAFSQAAVKPDCFGLSSLQQSLNSIAECCY